MRTLHPTWVGLCCGMLCALNVQAETTNLPTIRVSASQPTRVDTTTPTATTFISGEQIERSQAASIPELLTREANVLFRSSTGKSSDGQVAMRGFGENSGLRVLVEVDGHKLNRPDMGGLNWNQIPIGNIAYIEVLRGGQNVLYGNHALAGVIKITTKKGGDPRLYLRAVQGSDDFEQYSALATGGAGAWYADIGGDYLREPGFRTNSLSWSKTVHASLGRFIGDDGSLTLRASLGESYMQFPGPLIIEQMKEDPTQSNNAGDQESSSTNGLFTLLWEGNHNWGKTRLGAGYNFRDSRWSQSGIYARNQQQGFSLAPRIQFGPDQDHLIFGWDFFYDKLKHDQFTSATNANLQGWAELERFTTGPYVFAQREVIETLTLSGGARYEHTRTKNNHVDYDYERVRTDSSDPFIDHPIFGFPVPNPNYDPQYETVRVVNETNSYDGVVSKEGWAAELSLLWKPHEHISVWIGYDHSYRYPALDETASYQGHPLSDQLNENLEPETGNSIEAGFKYSDEHFVFSFTGFYMLLDDEIAFDNILNLNVNIGATERLGAELETAYAWERVGLSASAAFVDARFKEGPHEGKTIPLVPWAHGTVSAWIEPLKPLRLTTYYTYVTSQYQGNDYANEQSKLNKYGLLGARIDLNVFDHATLFVKGENLLDLNYASSAYSGVYYPGAGRSIQFGLTVEF